MDAKQETAVDEAATNSDQQPKRKRYRGPSLRSFKSRFADRNKTNKQKIKSLDYFLSNWYKETGVPSICLSLFTDKTGNVHVKPTGHSGFQTFANNPTVQAEFLKVAENLKDVPHDFQEDSNAINSTDFDQTVVDTMLSQNVLHLDVDSKRKLLTTLVLGNGLKRRKQWKTTKKPEWWPADIHFRSPNAQPKCNVMELDKILENCIAHLAERFEEPSVSSNDR